jgi:glutamate transport system ATP-binding protein
MSTGQAIPEVSSGTATTSRPQPLVVLRDVNKYFGQAHVLKDVSLEVQPGEVVVVVGPSGSGKSTMIRAINRLETITSGELLVDGRPIPSEGKALTRLRAEVGMVFQSFNLFAHMSILDNITLGPIKVSGTPRRQAEADARALLERVGISDHANKLPGQLSGGQQQRAAIARSLAMKPKMVLFDEPTSALDPEMIKEVLDVMRGLAAEGMTMIVVTHEMGFARSAANRVVFMDQGRIVEASPVADFFPVPQSARAQDFLSKIINH